MGGGPRLHRRYGAIRARDGSGQVGRATWGLVLAVVVLLSAALSPVRLPVAAASSSRVSARINAQVPPLPIAVQGDDAAWDVATVSISSADVVGPNDLADVVINVHNNKAIVYNLGGTLGNRMPDWVSQSVFNPVLAHRDQAIPAIQLAPGQTATFTLNKGSTDSDATYLLLILDVLEGMQVLASGDFLPDPQALSPETFYTVFGAWEEGFATWKQSAALDLLAIPTYLYERKWWDAAKAFISAGAQNPANLVDLFNLVHQDLGMPEATQLAGKLGLLSTVLVRLGQAQVASTEWDLLNAPETVTFSLVDLRQQDGVQLATPIVVSPSPVTAGSPVSFNFGVEPTAGQIQPREIFVDGRDPFGDAYWKAWACGGPTAPACEMLEPYVGKLFSAELRSAGPTPGQWSIRRAVAVLDDGTQFVFAANLGGFLVIASATTTQATISGTVVDQSNKALSGAKITFYPQTNPTGAAWGSFYVSTDPTGQYSMRLPPDTYQVFPTRDGYTALDYPVVDLRNEPPSATVRQDLTLHVNDSTLTGSVMTPGGQGLPGVRLAVYPVRKGIPIVNVTTDAQGHYAVPIASGIYGEAHVEQWDAAGYRLRNQTRNPFPISAPTASVNWTLPTVEVAGYPCNTSACTVTLTGKGWTQATGDRDVRLYLEAEKPAPWVLLGAVTPDSTGAFTVVRTFAHPPSGTYLLRAGTYFAFGTGAEVISEPIYTVLDAPSTNGPSCGIGATSVAGVTGAFLYPSVHPEAGVGDVRMLSPDALSYPPGGANTATQQTYSRDESIRFAFTARPRRAEVTYQVRFTGPDGRVGEFPQLAAPLEWVTANRPTGITVPVKEAGQTESPSLGWADFPGGAYVSEVLIDGSVVGCAEWSIQ